MYEISRIMLHISIQIPTVKFNLMLESIYLKYTHITAFQLGGCTMGLYNCCRNAEVSPFCLRSCYDDDPAEFELFSSACLEHIIDVNQCRQLHVGKWING